MENQASKYISHVYKQEIKEKSEVLKKKTISIKQAFGSYYIDVNTYFSEIGDEILKYKDVGYGNVCFLGNIDGKTVTQGLFYKNLEIKKEIENLIISLTFIDEDVRQVIDYIHKNNGQPNIQHSVLYYLAKNQ
jgi:hypothetical protein